LSTEKVHLAFEMGGVTLPLESILPSKQVNPAIRKSRKYATILASIQEVGLIEPPIVYRSKKTRNTPESYVLVDGHIRVDILRALGEREVFCLISTDDEAFTYNHKVNRLPPIQEHFMIMRAIDNGVAEDRIAKALNVDVARIRKQRTMLEGICSEAVELLRDKPVTPNGLRSLRKVKPIRQIEIAELVNAVGNYTTPYIKALVAASPQEQCIPGGNGKPSFGVKAEDLAKMEKEMAVLERDFRLIEQSYGKNVLNLVLARGYLAKLLSNNRVLRYLSGHYADILAEFQKIVEASSLEA